MAGPVVLKLQAILALALPEQEPYCPKWKKSRQSEKIEIAPIESSSHAQINRLNSSQAIDLHYCHVFSAGQYMTVMKMQGILTARYDLQFAGKLCHLCGQFKKARTDGIPVKLPSQKKIIGTDMEVEGDLHQKLQRWFSLSAFHIPEMFDTDIEFLGGFLLRHTFRFAECFQASCKIGGF